MRWQAYMINCQHRVREGIREMGRQRERLAVASEVASSRDRLPTESVQNKRDGGGQRENLAVASEMASSHDPLPLDSVLNKRNGEVERERTQLQLVRQQAHMTHCQPRIREMGALREFCCSQPATCNGQHQFDTQRKNVKPHQERSIPRDQFSGCRWGFIIYIRHMVIWSGQMRFNIKEVVTVLLYFFSTQK